VVPYRAKPTKCADSGTALKRVNTRAVQSAATLDYDPGPSHYLMCMNVYELSCSQDLKAIRAPCQSMNGLARNMTCAHIIRIIRLPRRTFSCPIPRSDLPQGDHSSLVISSSPRSIEQLGQIAIIRSLIGNTRCLPALIGGILNDVLVA
jgi:hypothetical protein